MRDLAAQIGMSDVGLKKLLKAHGVTGPPQGHWNRVHAGHTVPKPPEAPARGPGEHPYLRVDKRLAHLPEAAVPSSSGPFASAKVPEDLEELRARELKAIGRAVSAKKMAVAHLAIRSLLDSDDRERAKAESRDWYSVPTLKYDSPYEKRRLRILSAVFSTLQRRGYAGRSNQQDYHTEFSVVIGDTRVELVLDEATSKTTYSRYNVPRSDPKQSAAVKLKLTAGSSVWQDTTDAPLESRVADICAGIIVEGERSYREQLRVMEEQAERARIAAEQYRQERLRKANADRGTALIESGRLIAEAEHLRSLIAKVALAVNAGAISLTADQLAEWKLWAEQEADKLDPVISGQVLAHLTPPEVD